VESFGSQKVLKTFWSKRFKRWLKEGKPVCFQLFSSFKFMSKVKNALVKLAKLLTFKKY
jgi:hypothetical protein